jgi:hypothetical protein
MDANAMVLVSFEVSMHAQLVWLVRASSLRVTGHKVQVAGLGLEAMCVPIIYLSMVFSWSCGSQCKLKL